MTIDELLEGLRALLPADSAPEGIDAGDHNFQCEGCVSCTNCRFCRGCEECQRCTYCEDCVKCAECTQSKRCRECASSSYLEDCRGCRESRYLALCVDCIDCVHCFACVGLKGAEFCILNERFSKREYFEEVRALRAQLEQRIADGWRIDAVRPYRDRAPKHTEAARVEREAAQLAAQTRKSFDLRFAEVVDGDARKAPRESYATSSSSESRFAAHAPNEPSNSRSHIDDEAAPRTARWWERREENVSPVSPASNRANAGLGEASARRISAPQSHSSAPSGEWESEPAAYRSADANVDEPRAMGSRSAEDSRFSPRAVPARAMEPAWRDDEFSNEARAFEARGAHASHPGDERFSRTSRPSVSGSEPNDERFSRTSRPSVSGSDGHRPPATLQRRVPEADSRFPEDQGRRESGSASFNDASSPRWAASVPNRVEPQRYVEERDARSERYDHLNRERGEHPGASAPVEPPAENRSARGPSEGRRDGGAPSARRWSRAEEQHRPSMSRDHDAPSHASDASASWSPSSPPSGFHSRHPSASAQEDRGGWPRPKRNAESPERVEFGASEGTWVPRGSEASDPRRDFVAPEMQQRASARSVESSPNRLLAFVKSGARGDEIPDEEEENRWLRGKLPPRS